MYATPVIYTFSSMRGFIRAILLCNPMTAVMENFRYLLFGVGQPMIGAGIVSWIVTLLLAVFGIIYYSNVCKTCIDTI